MGYSVRLAEFVTEILQVRLMKKSLLYDPNSGKLRLTLSSLRPSLFIPLLSISANRHSHRVSGEVAKLSCWLRVLIVVLYLHLWLYAFHFSVLEAIWER